MVSWALVEALRNCPENWGGTPAIPAAIRAITADQPLFTSTERAAGSGIGHEGDSLRSVTAACA